MTPRCLIPGCKTFRNCGRTPIELFCPEHWAMVPMELRDPAGSRNRDDGGAAAREAFHIVAGIDFMDYRMSGAFVRDWNAKVKANP